MTNGMLKRLYTAYDNGRYVTHLERKNEELTSRYEKCGRTVSDTTARIISENRSLIDETVRPKNFLEFIAYALGRAI